MILVINVCREKLHDLEFVKPIEDILKKEEIKFFTRHYLKLQKGDLMNARKVIICGTSLKDEEYLESLGHFHFLRDENFRKPVLGICAGMQIIGLAQDLDEQVGKLNVLSDFSHILKKKTEIGFFHENFKKKFLGLEGDHEVYHLHNNYVQFSEDFGSFVDGKVVQAVKHKKKEVYGVLFHPEVRQKEMILEFVNNG
ncbi:C26 family cysteine hydrolase domain-containing family [archaeon]|jgi:GMP synthase-like glutamine amidotransferase|nr:C26 family cysteine hydrolase domain-containing family [archaeon]MBT3577908.1 C26 family cysteine hydrolase domain-containing family [archaeon]MBT6819728.1 C26 family cysteine hydrolase domain-containing family [archaeon]MBT6956012.1 C26 family cysteine hydrolase domain-containing family [archaeon]MBT7025511.1 C26 family cysteine hydrolase domain-containing family [archaeon]